MEAERPEEEEDECPQKSEQQGAERGREKGDGREKSLQPPVVGKLELRDRHETRLLRPQKKRKQHLASGSKRE